MVGSPREYQLAFEVVREVLPLSGSSRGSLVMVYKIFELKEDFNQPIGSL